jgi:hypothetical protein
MSANATRIDDLPGGDIGGGGGMPMPPVGSMPMPGGPTPALPAALQPISTSVHEQSPASFGGGPAFPSMGGGGSAFPPMSGGSQPPVYNPNQFATQPMQSQMMPAPVSSDTINQIMSTINVAGSHLPSRDIPMMNPHDDQSRPNYVPGGGNGDYIQQYSSLADVAKNKSTSSDDIFDKLQIPIMCAVVFFLFQLPVVRKALFKYLPSFYFTDGNPKISAILIQALVFAAGVYLINTFTR